MRGIRDKDRKLKLLHLLLETNTLDQLMHQLAGRIGDPAIATSFAQSLPKWKTSDPTGTVGPQFLRAVEAVLSDVSFELADSRELVWKGSVEDIVAMFPDQEYQKVAAELGLPPRETNEWTEVSFWKATEFVSAEDGVRRGRLDFRMCYMVPDAAKSWRRVTKNGFYGQYSHCQAALERLLAGGEWRDFVETNRVPGAVSLGAGSASKDYRVLRSLRDLSQPGSSFPYLTVIDCSPYMLRDTGEDLRSVAKGCGEVRLVCMDFTDLRQDERLRKDGSVLAWFCNGGTIGNVQEGALFQSLAHVARNGDRLFVSLETLPEFANEGDREAFESALLLKYEQPEIRGILESPLRGALPHLWKRGHVGSIDGEDIQVRLVSGRRKRHSDVPKSLTAELFVPSPAGDVVIFASTRYDQQALIDFAAIDEFKFLYEVASPLNPAYKFLVFEFSG